MGLRHRREQRRHTSVTNVMINVDDLGVAASPARDAIRVANGQILRNQDVTFEMKPINKPCRVESSRWRLWWPGAVSARTDRPRTPAREERQADDHESCFS